MWHVMLKICCMLTIYLVVSGEITFIEPRKPLVGNPSLPGAVWPKPQVQETGSVKLWLDAKTFIMKSNAEKCDIIAKALKRYRLLIFKDAPFQRRSEIESTFQYLHSMTILVKEFSGKKCSYPGHKDDESYTLQITISGRAYLMTNTVWGALRGLETFSQLVYEDSQRLMINVTYIVDWPRYFYRGIMLDTARHFQPISLLKQNLDAMSFNKMNVFHWHIVDDQSFPFESRTFPELSKKGAYSPSQIYKQEDIRDVIEYARLLGIRVIPEFDTPGHTHAFGKAFPELLTSCYGEGRDKPNTPLDGIHAARENFDPTKNATYDFLKTFFREVRKIFVDEYIHLGMDEVYYDCWKSSPEVENFMLKKGFDDISEVEQYYAQRTVSLVEEIGYRYMAWQDPIDNGVQMDNNTVIEIWKAVGWKKKAKEVANLGYQMILSACWYLNYIGYGEDWMKYYVCEPRSPFTDEKQKLQMIGGEACMWAEFVDETNLLSRLWPRASAVAERLWSSSETMDLNDARYRLHQQRCRMLKRGIPAQPIFNGYCNSDETIAEKHFLTYEPLVSKHWLISIAIIVILAVCLVIRRTHNLCRNMCMRLFIGASKILFWR